MFALTGVNAKAETGILVPEVEEVHALTREAIAGFYAEPEPRSRSGTQVAGPAKPAIERKRPTIGKSESAVCHTGRAVGQGNLWNGEFVHCHRNWN